MLRMALLHVFKKMTLPELHQPDLRLDRSLYIHFNHFILSCGPGLVANHKRMNDNMVLLPKMVLQHNAVNVVLRIGFVFDDFYRHADLNNL